MTIKNISGGSLSFNVGTRNYVLADNAEQVIDDNHKTLNDVTEHIRKNRLEVVSSPPVAQYCATPDTYGYALVTLNTVIDTDAISIGGEIFEIDEAANGVVAGTAVTAVDATDMAVTAAGLKAAINANSVLDALGVKADDIINTVASVSYLVIEARGDTLIADVAITTADATITIAKTAAAVGGGYRWSVKTFDPGTTTAMVNTGLDSIDTVHVLVKLTSASDITQYDMDVHFDGNISIGGGFVHLSDSGTYDFADGDTVTVIAFGK